MIEVIGPEDSSERRAAEQIKSAFIELWPDLVDSAEDRIRIAANAKIYGYDIQDIDIVVVANFAGSRVLDPLRPLRSNPNDELVRKDVFVRSLVLAIEVKAHDQRSVRFVGKSGFVKYGRRGPEWHDATEQNVRQVHVLKAYLNDFGAKDLFVSGIVIFQNLEEADLPPRPHAMIGGIFSASPDISH
jgi:hypothetical protein